MCETMSVKKVYVQRGKYGDRVVTQTRDLAFQGNLKFDRQCFRDFRRCQISQCLRLEH